MIKKLEQLVEEGKIRYFKVCFNEDEPGYNVMVLTNGGLMVCSEDEDMDKAIKVLLKDINEN